MIHHFFDTHGFGETRVQIHADNCTGQNKNRFMMYYLAWRVLVSLHEEITLSFLLVGHTKFAHWCFRLAKQCFRKTNVSSLDDIAKTIRRSSFVNVPQLVGDLDGDVHVPTYDWSSFFEDHMIKIALKGSTIFGSQPRIQAVYSLRHPAMMWSVVFSSSRIPPGGPQLLIYHL